MIVGTEWLIEAFDCEANSLRDAAALQSVFAGVIGDLGLKIVGDPHWHQFGGEAGITGLVMLTESHHENRTRRKSNGNSRFRI